MAILPILPRARSQAPQTVDVRIGCNSPQLFTGRLELKWYVNKRLVQQYLSHEITVTDGGQTFRLLVPQVIVRAEKTDLSVGARFLMEREVIELDDPPVPTFPASWKRSFVMAVVQPQEVLLRQSEREANGERGVRFERGLTDSLNLEQFNPFGTVLVQAETDSPLELLTYPARLTPEDMPSSSAGYASFDLLLLEGPGFEQLKGKQLEALGQWVAAGGRVVVWPYGKLTSAHADFLNRMAGNVPAGAGDLPSGDLYGLDERGRLVISDAARAKASKYAKYTPGLGRSLIIHEALDPQTDFSTPEWKGTVAFLWSVRSGQIDAIKGTGVWQFDGRADRTGRTYRPYAPRDDDLARNIRQFLLPERIEGVPLAVVIVILGLYLLTVAPGDFFLLGRLNLRKYTWGLFVVVSAAFTWCTVLVAKSYMGHADYHTSLVFADLADSGGPEGRPQIVRTNRFDMLFVAEQSMIEIPIRGELYADLTDRAVLSEKLQRERERRPFVFAENDEMDVADSVITDLPIYSGAMPNAYSVHQQMRQWSPRINRRTRLRDDAALLAAIHVDWSMLRADDWHTSEGQRVLREAVLAKEPQAQVLLFHGNRAYDVANNQSLVYDGPQQPIANSLLFDLVHAASVRTPAGMFSVVSQIAPTGGEYLEDLSLLDGSRGDQWLLAIAIRRENEWIVYRKLFPTR